MLSAKAPVPQGTQDSAPDASALQPKITAGPSFASDVLHSWPSSFTA